MKKIAILGATGHIAKNLISNFKSLENHDLFLFARSDEKLNNFLKNINYRNGIEKIRLDGFANEKYDAVINCIGVGDPGKVKTIGPEIFRLTEYYDNFILDYLEDNNNCIYINFSSGAAYGTNFSKPADQNKYNEININNIGKKDNYGIVKLYFEAKHRSYEKFNIIDLRVFAFFSRYIDLNSKYFIKSNYFRTTLGNKPLFINYGYISILILNLFATDLGKNATDIAPSTVLLNSVSLERLIFLKIHRTFVNDGL